MITIDKKIGKPETKYGYLNLTTEDGVTHGNQFPLPNTPLTIKTGTREYFASMNTMQNQIWGALRRWYKDENIYEGDKVRITYDPKAQHTIDGRVLIEISVLERAELPNSIADANGIEAEEERITEINMQMEQDLENFLVANLHLIHKDLELYKDAQGKSGRQFSTEVGYIDLLCKQQKEYVVIELKKGRSSDIVVGQISRYIGWVKDKLADGANVKGIIIVHDFDPKLKYAALANPNIELKYYQIKIDFVSEEDVIRKN